MAITITQKPTSPNAAYTRLVYVISGSSNTTAPQFEYVMDVYESGSINLISRVTQTVNPAGVAVFDPSRIIQDQLEYNSNWKITNTVSVLSNSKKFALKFGEQYGTSISSSVTVYPNITDNVITTFTGVVDPTQGSYNFPSQSYDSKTALTTFDWYTGSSFSNAQLDRFRVVDYEVDYETISVLGVGSSISNISYRTYDQAGNLMVTNSISGFGLSMYDIFAGPKNFIDKGSVFQSQFEAAWFYYSIAITLGDSSVKYYWYKRSISESNEKVRFAFINKLGVWDYYNNYNPVRRSSDIQRENVTLPRVDYSSTLSPYNINRRGEKSYFVDHTDRFTVDTPLLDKTKANWLEQLLESPSVFIQRGSNFVPVVITNNSYRHNNDTYRNKLFKYTIEFEPANQPFGEWVPEYAQKYCPGTPPPTPTPSITPTPTPTPTPLPPNCATSSFDPTLSGSLTLYHWYDFTDCSTITFGSGYEVTSIQDKGDAAITTSLSVNTGSYFSGPIFQGSNSGSLFNSDRFDWKGLETTTVPATMVATGSTLTYVGFLEIVGPSEGRANIPGEFDKTKGTVLYGGNQAHIGYRGIQPIRYNTASYVEQPDSQSIVPPEGNLMIGNGLQKGAGAAVFTGSIYDGGYDSLYMVMSEYTLDYNGLGDSKFGNIKVLYGSGSSAREELIKDEDTTENSIHTIFSVGYSPIGVGPLYTDNDVSRTRIKHVMIYSGSISMTDTNNLYQEYLNTVIT